jgi:hypothetical protein
LHNHQLFTFILLFWHPKSNSLLQLRTAITAFITLCLFTGCKKTNDRPQNAESFSLVLNSNGGMQIHGKYVFDLPCDTSHYITVPVLVNDIGHWQLATDSINGLKFSGAGDFTSKGLQNIKLYGKGSPIFPERTTIKLKVGNQEASDALLPLKSFLDINRNGIQYLGLEYPSGVGELRSGPQYQNSNGILIPSCQYYQVPNPLDHFQLIIDYKGFPFNPAGVPEPTQWQAYLPAKHPIADFHNPVEGFEFILKYVAPSDITTGNVPNDGTQYVQIISRGQYSTNILVQGQIKTFPVYRIKIKFAAKLGDGFSPASTISGEAIVTYWSINAYY